MPPSRTGSTRRPGADSIQSAIMSGVPELRKRPNVSTWGLMAVDDGNGVLALVDIETGRRHIAGHASSRPSAIRLSNREDSPSGSISNTSEIFCGSCETLPPVGPST